MYASHPHVIEANTIPPPDREPPTVRFGRYCDEHFDALVADDYRTGVSSVVENIDRAEVVAVLMGMLDDDGVVRQTATAALRALITKTRADVIRHAARSGVGVREWNESANLDYAE